MISLQNISDEELAEHIRWGADDDTKFNRATFTFAVMVLDEYFTRKKMRTFHDRADVGHR